jgi:hypothetical protein
MFNKKPAFKEMKNPDDSETCGVTKVVKEALPTESKAERAMKIMEAQWGDIQNKKVQRKDVIKIFIDEVGLTKAGASTYYGNIKKKLTNPG